MVGATRGNARELEMKSGVEITKGEIMNNSTIHRAAARCAAMMLCLVASALAGPTKSIPVGTVPIYLALNPSTNRIYVSSLTGNSVSVIDGSTDTVIATVPTGFPTSIDVDATTNMIYVVNSIGASVSVIDGSSNTVVATITQGLSSPFGLSVNSVTNQIFVSNNSSNNVAVIDGATNSVIASVPVGNNPAGVRVNSTANLIYVANNGSGTISVINGQSDTVQATFSLPQGAAPGNVALDPITNHLFVTDGSNPVVYALDASIGTLLKTITGGKVQFKSPAYVAMFQPGKTILISDDSSLSAVIEVNESTYGSTAGLTGGSGPIGIAVNRKTGKIYVAESSSATVNVYAH
jgi:YVTN family beta-propeller protein